MNIRNSDHILLEITRLYEIFMRLLFKVEMEKREKVYKINALRDLFLLFYICAELMWFLTFISNYESKSDLYCS